LANYEKESWSQLTDRNLKEGRMQESTGEIREIKIIRCFEPEIRDKNIDIYSTEPSLIDARLEVVNAVTELK
jgi:hypothetical protein